MMSFVWHYLDKLYTGSGLMLVLQLCFFYGALGMLLRIIDACLPQKNRSLAALVILLLPLYPQILVYSGTIVKDNQFAFSFLLIMSILAYYTMTGKRLSLWLLAVLLPVLIYGMSVKFQAQYCSVIIIVWMGALVTTSSSLFKKVGTACLIGILAFGSMTAMNNTLVPEKQKNYSWQYVKLYDLAAISIGTQADLIPATNKTATYTFQELNAQFVHYRVDPLVFGLHPLLHLNRSTPEMDLLQQTWIRQVLAHPFWYLQHRTFNLAYALLSRPDFDHILAALNATVPQDSSLYPTVYGVVATLGYLFLSHFLIIALGVCYWILSLMAWSKSRAAPVLFCFSSLALLMVGILFFLSMAGTPRYTYISIIMIQCSHVFAYMCYQALRGKTAQSQQEEPLLARAA